MALRLQHVSFFLNIQFDICFPFLVNVFHGKQAQVYTLKKSIFLPHEIIQKSTFSGSEVASAILGSKASFRRVTMGFIAKQIL